MTTEVTWLSTAQAAEHLWCGQRHVGTLIRDGKLPAIRVGNRYRVRLDLVARYQAERGQPRRRPDTDLRPHGTRPAYVRHRRRREDACEACKAFVRVEEAERREARARLRDRYPDEWDALYQRDKDTFGGWENGASNRASRALASRFPDEFQELLAGIRESS